MRASRLVALLSLLQARGRMTAGQLAAELEVSQRTVLRDIEALSLAGVPVYPLRGRSGGFQLLDGYRSVLPAAGGRPVSLPPGPSHRARVRLSVHGRRLAALTGRPPGLRIRRSGQQAPGRRGWAEAWVRIESPQAAVLDILSLGADIEVLDPAELRAGVRETAERIAALHEAALGGIAPPRGDA
jgi:predicted DNA-binding transcriptional regulator YafY